MGKQALTSLPGIIGHFRKERVKRVDQMLPDLCPVLFVHRFLKDGLHQPVHRERARLRLIAALLEAGFAVYLVNPRTVDHRRKPSGAKTDAIDAYLLAKTGRSDLADLRRLQPDAAQIQELKTLTRDQDALIQSQTRLVNQLTACLKAYYPVALQLFTKVQQHSTLVFLQTYPTPEAAKAAPWTS
jgi:hypothetical protein